MSRKVADVLWEMLVKAGVKRCYGIVAAGWTRSSRQLSEM
jgi:hypothetical protein